MGQGRWESGADKKVRGRQRRREHRGLYSLAAGTSTSKSLLGSGFVDTKSTA